MTEQELLRDCLIRLNRIGATYMLTGSMASNAWGIPRTTHDLDFVIQLAPSNIGRLVDAFQPDYFVDEQAIRSAYRPPHQFNLIHVPSALKIDFWLLKPDPFEQEMFRRRVSDQWMGEKVYLATPEDVLLHKLLWHRITPSQRQLGDVGGIVAVQQGRLDEAYLRKWGRDLGLQDLLDEALAGRIKPKET